VRETWNQQKEFPMKNKGNLIRIAVTLAAVIGFALAALSLTGCPQPTGKGGGGGIDDGGALGETTSPTGIVMVKILAGTFSMGSPETEANRNTDETQHQVTLTKSFYMGKYQVTQEQYQAVMGSNPSSFTSAVDGESGTPGKLPVETVSWYGAIVFCNKLSVAEGLSPVYSISGSTDTATWGTVPTSSDATWNAVVTVSGATGYRLPTEAQWEYVCRAGTATAFNNGNDDYSNSTAVGTVAWYNGNAGSKTHEVGIKTANAWSLYDMHGNLLEWCWDLYGNYASGTQTDPVGASSGSYRVRRGGSWDYSAESARSAYRGRGDPAIRNNFTGFRLVRS
jgi:formylglycine-generating enzyme required for sulfatase activity